MNWLGLDIGGANLKAADGQGWARSVPFPLWRNPAGLGDALAAILSEAPSCDALSVTMTGELCDCFRTKAEGVSQILNAVGDAAASRRVQVYLVDGRFEPIDVARELPHLAAASNWHALARFAARYTSGEASLLVDIGSTTTDIIPTFDGQPATTAVTDTDRLLAGQFVYTGVGRTPICAVTQTLSWRGRACPVAAELFATTADAYVLVGSVAEQPSADWTADGRPLTKEFAHERIARMFCADRDTLTFAEAIEAARQVCESQKNQLSAAIDRVCLQMPDCPKNWVISGSGEFLASRLAGNTPIVSLAGVLGPEISHAAAAHSVAVLAIEAAKSREIRRGR